MKQVLLGIAAVFPKIGFGKFTQLLRRYFLPAREITLSQDPLDPDVDWERAEPLVGEEHHAVCDLHAHPRQIAQVLLKIAIRKLLINPDVALGVNEIGVQAAAAELMQTALKDNFIVLEPVMRAEIDKRRHAGFSIEYEVKS